MSEESTTPEVVELTRRQLEAMNRGDMDAVMSRCPPDGVYDTSPDGLIVYEVRQRSVPSSASGGMPSRSLRTSQRTSSTSATASCSWSFARKPVRPTARVVFKDAKRTSWTVTRWPSGSGPLRCRGVPLQECFSALTRRPQPRPPPISAAASAARRGQTRSDRSADTNARPPEARGRRF
jgi:hypothetical protein